MPMNPDIRPEHLKLSSLSIDSTSHSWTDDLPVCHMSGLGLSTNQIYREDGLRKEEHEFEDQSCRFQLDDNMYFYGVFDGHDGSRAASFASQRMPAEVLLGQLRGDETDKEIRGILVQAFNVVEKGFFESIDDLLAEKTDLQFQLQGLNFYEVCQQHPEVVARLREVNSQIEGGTTAVVALIVKNKLYIANAGDSRALLCKTDENGIMRVLQLSVDHNLQNEDELLRLSHLGLDIQTIRQGSKLGNQENTRCIGNHLVKCGYKEFEILSEANEEPVIAVPEICGGIPIDDSCKFLLLMSDGLYNSLEEATGTKEANEEIAEMVLEQFSMQSTLTGVAQAAVDKIVRLHHDKYMTDSTVYKRDDITLLVRNFNQPLTRASANLSPNPLTFKSWDTKWNDPSSTYKETISTTVESTEVAPRFHTNPVTLDQDGKVEPYVDFSIYYRLVEEKRLAGTLPEGLDL